MHEEGERSYGIIPLKKEESRTLVLLVRLRSGNHWSFPKGHSEDKESEKEAAERELYEETGLKISRYLSDDPVHESYFVQRPGGLKKKQVSYYIAEVEGKIHIQKNEILECVFVDISEVTGWLTYDEAKKVWEEVLARKLF